MCDHMAPKLQHSGNWSERTPWTQESEMTMIHLKTKSNFHLFPLEWSIWSETSLVPFFQEIYILIVFSNTGSQDFILLLLLIFAENWASNLDHADWASEFHYSAFLYVCIPGITSTHHYTQVFTWGLEI